MSTVLLYSACSPPVLPEDTGTANCTFLGWSSAAQTWRKVAEGLPSRSMLLGVAHVEDTAPGSSS
jgi:hypothetical protein